jgi:type II secretory pathway predicted ATPase ExeA
MISNINADHHQILQLILVGQPQLRDLLQSPELHQFAQRISSDFHLRPLDHNEVIKYISFRLQAAGAPPPPRTLFSIEACNRIATASGGIPRMINILCDTALVYGFARGEKTISAKLIDDVIADKQQYSIFPLKSAFSGP